MTTPAKPTRRYRHPSKSRTKAEKVYQAQADDDAIEQHRDDDRCHLAHEVDRNCPRCGKLELVWIPFTFGYWCTDCSTHVHFVRDETSSDKIDG